jgi:hypothetical protein
MLLEPAGWSLAQSSHHVLPLLFDELSPHTFPETHAAVVLIPVARPPARWLLLRCFQHPGTLASGTAASTGRNELSRGARAGVERAFRAERGLSSAEAQGESRAC